MKIFFVLILVLLVVYLPASQSLPKKQLYIGSVVLTVEIASTSDSRSRGLMYRETLNWNNGMLFVYKREHVMEFWMRNTYVDLDIGFFDKNRVLKVIKTMKRLDETPVSSEVPVMYALEVSKGWFKSHGIVPGIQFRMD